MNRRQSTINTGHKNTNDPQKKYHLGRVSKNILMEGLNQFHGANLTLSSDVDQDTCMKDPKLINASFPKTYKSIYKKEIKSN